MATGTVKWFNDAKGYGFITPDGGEDVFVHHTSIQMDGFRTLKEGERVEYLLPTRVPAEVRGERGSVADLLDAPGDDGTISRVRGAVGAMTAKFPVYEGAKAG